MTELRIEGIPNPVRVDPSFRDLSPERQAAEVDSIRAAWDARSQGTPAPTPSAEPTGAGFDALQQGTHTASRSLAATARVAGNAAERYIGPGAISRNLQSAGQFLDTAVDPVPGYVPSGPAVSQAYRDGDVGGVVRNIPGLIAETLPGMGATLAAGAAGSVVGGPVGGLAAAGLASGAQTFGDVAEERARNNGNADPTDAGNLAAAGVTTAGIAALDAVGARGVGHAASGALARPVGAAGRLRQAASTTVREAATEGGQELAQQVGQTAGTRRGLEIDPAAIATAATAGGATRAAISAPGAVVGGTIQSVAIRGAEREAGNMPVAEAASVERVNRLLEEQAAATDNVTGRTVADEDILNAARTTLESRVRTVMRQGRRAGWVNQDEYNAMTAAFDTAARHNKELTDSGLDPDGEHFRSGLAVLDDLQNAPATFSNSLRELFRDQNTLAAASRKKNLRGPAEAIGRALGGTAAVVGGAVAGGPMGAAAGLAANLGGNPLAARVGGVAGRAVDRFLGTRHPTIVLARDKALRILRRAGAEDPGSITDALNDLDRVLTDDRLAARAAAGLKTDPDTMAEKAVELSDRRRRREIELRRAKLEREATAASVAAGNDGEALQTLAQREARQRAAEEDAAWGDHNRATRPTSPTPTQIDALLAARRKAEEAVRKADERRAARDMIDQSTVGPDNTAAEIKTREASLDEVARMRRKISEQLKRDAEQAARGAEQDEAALGTQAERDAARRAREIEEAYRQQSRRTASETPGQPRDTAADIDRRAAELEASAPNRGGEPNLDAVTRSQMAEWEATLVSRARNRAAAAKPPAAPVQAQEAPPATPVAEQVAEPAQSPSQPPQPPMSADTPTARVEPPETDMGMDGSPITPGGPLRGWRDYLRRAMSSKGRRVTREELDGLIDTLEENGDLESDMAQAMRERQFRLPVSILDQMIATLAAQKGFDFASEPDQVLTRTEGGPAANHYNGVHSPAKWESAKQSRQAHVAFYRDAALQRGDQGLQEALASLDQPDHTMPPATRKVIARAVVQASPDAETASFRRAALAPWLDDKVALTLRPTASRPPRTGRAEPPQPPAPAPEPEAPPVVEPPAPTPPRVLTPAEVTARLLARRKAAETSSKPPPERRAPREVPAEEPSVSGRADPSDPALIAARARARYGAAAKLGEEWRTGSTTVRVGAQDVEATDSVVAQVERAIARTPEGQRGPMVDVLNKLRAANVFWHRRMIETEKVDKGGDR